MQSVFKVWKYKSFHH